ncbi:thiol-disulfide oxidoreductase LTO1 isoform X2 [Canna indica]|uniref:Thiol-disulfide oxidoreductase LTO1 isoform X2 n=1 Tax=Canna indica TaxID=4628 RepID=A0AAQ3QDW5_9LILI|nr:thiol-disulfide oxidoreductase LTO1 isoform X2 [Canna indica]
MASISAALALSRPPLRRPAARSPPRLQRAGVVWSLKCRAESEPSPREELERRIEPSLFGISTSSWSAGLGTIGFLETAYLTYLKFSGAEAFCPVGGGNCSDILNSDYSFAFGLPLPLFGMLAYGSVALLSLQKSGKNLLSGLGETDARFILLVTTTSMATASAYFLYILNTKFTGTTCSYCLFSAVLSFSLFFITLKDIGLEEIKNVLGLQLAVAGVVVTALTNTYSMIDAKLPTLNDITLERYETEITTQSTPFALSLAKHLNSIGAKMYGAFWCSHCNEQKQMFGREAAKILDYVECFPNGAGKGRKMALECGIIGIEGFPTWIIDGKIISGEQDLQALAEASGYIAEDASPS